MSHTIFQLTKSELSREDGTRGGVGCEWAVAGAKLLDSSLPPLAAWLTRLEEAHVARKRGDVQLALRSLQPLIDHMQLVRLIESINTLHAQTCLTDKVYVVLSCFSNSLHWYFVFYRKIVCYY